MALDDTGTRHISSTERLPAALRIARLLREKIERREFQPGEWLPTERELAQEFGADRATIRAAVSHLAEQRLIVRETGRRPWVSFQSDEAIAAVEKQSRPVALQTVAAIVPQPVNYPALSAIQRGILRVLQQRKAPYRLIVFDNQGDTWAESVVLERQALEAIENEGITGTILWQIGGQDTLSTVQRLQARGIPIVLLDRCPEDFACDFVGVDNRAAAREAVTYLLDLGHRRIAHLTSRDAILTVREREQGYREALLARNIQPAEEWICRLPDRDDLYPDVGPAFDQFFALPEPPTAVFVLKDLLAHAFIVEAQRRGLRVPDDISVVGFDDHDRYALQPPVLTTVHQPFESMGRHAAEILLRRLTRPNGSTVPYQHLLLPTPLVVRATCKSISGRLSATAESTGAPVSAPEGLSSRP